MGLFDSLFEMLADSGRNPDYPDSRAAGLMYPEQRRELGELLEELFAEVSGASEDEGPKGLIVPQSEYEFSGDVAAEAYHRWRQERAIERVVIVGSSRMVPFEGVAVTKKHGMETPFGRVEFDREWVDSVIEKEDVRILEEAFDPDLTIDVQLPFIQYVLDDIRVVPVLVGDVRPDEIAEVIDQLWGEETTRFVLSANLSEGFEPEKAAELDRETVEAVEQLEPEKLGRDHSLSRNALRGFILACRSKDLTPNVFETASSEDKVDRETVEKVAGYGAFGFH